MVVAALLIGAMAGTVYAIFRGRDRFELRSNGMYIEVWSHGELRAEFQPEDGEVYEVLRDLKDGRL